MDLSTSNLSDFAKPPGFNILIRTLCLLIVLFYNSTRAHMVLHLSHVEGGFGVTFNDVTKDAEFYTITSRFVSWFGAFSQERQELWLTKDDLRNSSSWSSPPLMFLRDIHYKLLNQFDWKEVCVPSPSQVNEGTSGGTSNADVTVIPSQQVRGALNS
jgi:hypothetical protein